MKHLLIPIGIVGLLVLFGIFMLRTNGPITSSTDAAELSGTVTKIDSYKSIVSVWISDSNKFTFGFRTHSNPSFEDWVSVGDSIFKSSFADSISAYKKDGSTMKWPILR